MKIKKRIKNIEKTIEKDAEEVEEWVVERKKFFIKFGGIIGFILISIIISKLI